MTDGKASHPRGIARHRAGAGGGIRAPRLAGDRDERSRSDALHALGAWRW